MPKIKTTRSHRKAIEVRVRGRVIARIVPEVDRKADARTRLQALRRRARIRGDIVSPLGETWDAERGLYYRKT